jgi:dipeptidyl aminopeptidase/acylaminoacyl peptidase
LDSLPNVKPSHLGLILTPGAPTLSPDGRTAVVAVTGIDLDADDYTSQLWLVATDGAAAPRQLTHGWRDTAPVYSPDGAFIAFVRSERGADKQVGKPQLWVLPTGGGEPRRLTEHPLGVGNPVWHPGSGRLVYQARVPEEGRYGSVEGVGPEKEPPRRITRLRYKLDGFGFLGARYSQLWTVDVDARPVKPGEEGGPRQLTSGDADHTDPDWSPDGTLLTFVAARHENAGNDLRNDVFVCAADGSGLRQLTDGTLGVGSPRFSTDGSSVFFIGAELGPALVNAVQTNDSLWSVPLTGGAATRLTDTERYNLGAIRVVEDGVLAPNENRGAVELLLVPAAGGEPTVLVGGQRQVVDYDRAGDTLVATVAGPTSWGEVLVWNSAGERVLTVFGSGYAGEVAVLPQVELNATAPDGYPVHGWVVRPAGEGPHPVLLMIHGGPFTQYGWRQFDEAQVYAGAGYAVVMGNPRGSSGYGQAHGQAVRGNVGEVSTADLMALLDAALADPALDASRVGVLGGSHGGFMTTWLAAHEGHRFKAAVSERAVNAIDSFTGSSDIGWFFANDLYGTDLDQQRAQSPLQHADKIDIPVLIIHSEQDWRCPVEQAQRLFVALKHRGVTTEFLLFPGEGHELSRSGLPSHRVARFEAILDWFQRYL